jgi:hypothetical protein
MRWIVALLIALIALPVAADDGFALGLAEMDFSAEPTEEAPARALDSLEAEDVATDHAESLVYRAALQPRTVNERSLALWNSDLGRVHYAMAADQAMLGRQGLVNGGRMVGLGLATGIIGDGDPNGALSPALGHWKWAEMNANQKVQATVEASFIAALVYFMFANAD